MLSEGQDTITTLVQWSVALLAQRPDIQTKAIEAIRKFYTDEEPLCDPLDDQKCAYIAAMVREFLRYYCVLRGSSSSHGKRRELRREIDFCGEYHLPERMGV
jgi:3-hydroxyphenylacetate 6-hydroxylase